jgi:hypothetical protein
MTELGPEQPKELDSGPPMEGSRRKIDRLGTADDNDQDPRIAWNGRYTADNTEGCKGNKM